MKFKKTNKSKENIIIEFYSSFIDGSMITIGEQFINKIVTEIIT